MSDSVRPHRWQPTRLPHPWDSPGENTGVGCHFLLKCMKVKSETEVTQSCPTLRDPMDCSLPGSSTRGIFQARVLEWVAIKTQFSSVQFSCSVVSNCLQPHGLQPTRLLHPWDFPSKSTRVGCHCLLHLFQLKFALIFLTSPKLYLQLANVNFTQPDKLNHISM